MSRIARLIGTGFVAIALQVSAAAAADNPPVAVDDGGRALQGYDTVAYFTDGKPQPGVETYAYEYDGATWLFASAQHREAFAADPAKYAPQFGGYCAYAITQGHAIRAHPEVWSIVDGKLYLNLGPGAQEKWKADVPGNIARAVNNWPGALVDPGARQSTQSPTSNR